VEADRITVLSPLGGFRVEVASPLGRTILAQSMPAQRVEVASPLAVQLPVASALALEVLP
jgi:hypothetical protein